MVDVDVDQFKVLRSMDRSFDLTSMLCKVDATRRRLAGRRYSMDDDGTWMVASCHALFKGKTDDRHTTVTGVSSSFPISIAFNQNC